MTEDIDLDVGARVASALDEVSPSPQLAARVLKRVERHRVQRRRLRASASVAVAAAVVVAAVVVNAPRGDGEDSLMTDSIGAVLRWEDLPPAPLPNRSDSGAVWTGTEFVFWGGHTSSNSRAGNRADGAAFNPATQSWRVLPPAPVGPRNHHVAVWTGTEMLVWGGWRPNGPVEEPAAWVDGGAYNPATDAWRRIPDSPIGTRLHVGAAWTGTELVVVGGQPAGGPRANGIGAAYDPARDTWRLLPDLPVTGHTGGWAAWTGREVLYVRPGFRPGLSGRVSAPPHIFAYDPEADTWRDAASPPSGFGMVWGQAGMEWTGSHLVFVSGSWAYEEPWSRVEAVAYDPATDHWYRVADRDNEGNVVIPDTAVVWNGWELVTLNWSAHAVSALNPRTGRWTKLPSAPDSLFGFAIAVTDRGDVYVVGDSGIARLARIPEQE